MGANAAGKCIGKGGENVKRLKSEFSVWIKVMGRDDSIPGLEERTITVSGDNDNTLKAIKDVSMTELVNHFRIVFDISLQCKQRYKTSVQLCLVPG